MSNTANTGKTGINTRKKKYNRKDIAIIISTIFVTFIVTALLIMTMTCEQVTKVTEDVFNSHHTDNNVLSAVNEHVEDVVEIAEKQQQNITIVTGLTEGQNAETSSQLINTSILRAAIDNAKYGDIIKIPEGTYLFAINPNDSAATNIDEMGDGAEGSYEYHVIEMKSGITVIGEGQNDTILMPVGEYDYGLDMFYWNKYSEALREGTIESPKTPSEIDNREWLWLNNVHFKNFTIDSAKTRYKDPNKYNAKGKGFFFSLCKDSTWSNVSVKNTEGTGFGMDLLVNVDITDCYAEGCGKVGKGTDFKPGVGGSGFGIGTGVSEKESVTITNCTAKDNARFGFFFEHQSRFSNTDFLAEHCVGYTIQDCTSVGNNWGYGGERSNDVTYKNCIERQSKQQAMWFGPGSKRCFVQNCTLESVVDENGIHNIEKDIELVKKMAGIGVLTHSKFAGAINDEKLDQELTNAELAELAYRLRSLPGTLDIKYNEHNYWTNDINENSDSVLYAKERGVIKENDNKVLEKSGKTLRDALKIIEQCINDDNLKYVNVMGELLK